MSKLVKIPQPVADKLDQLRNFGYSMESIVACRTDSSANYAILRTIPFETFLQAVINGYEREKSYSDRHADLLRYYKRWTDGLMDCSYDDARAETVRDVLRILGIKVTGIKTEVSTNEHE